MDTEKWKKENCSPFFGPRKHFSPPTPHRELLNNFRPPIDSHCKILPLMFKTRWKFFAYLRGRFIITWGWGLHSPKSIRTIANQLISAKVFFIVFLHCILGFRKNEERKLFGLPQAAFIIFGPPPPSLATANF